MYSGPVEVGCRGFNTMSMSKALTSIGILGALKRKALENITIAAGRIVGVVDSW